MSIHTKLRWPAFQNVTRFVLGNALHASFSIHYGGLEHIPSDGPLLLAANHITWLDPFVIGLGVERLHFGMGKEEYYFWPGMRYVLGWLGAFPVARKKKYPVLLQKYSKERVDKYLLADNQFNYDEYFKGKQDVVLDIKKTLRHDERLTGISIAQYLLMKNEALIIHPEGTRHCDGIIRDCKTGVARIVLDLYQLYGVQTTVVPCAVAYAPRGFRSNITVQFGVPIAVKGTVDSFTECLEQKIKELYAVAYAAANSGA